MKPKTSQIFNRMYRKLNPTWKKKIPAVYQIFLPPVFDAYLSFPVLNCMTDYVHPAFDTFFYLTSIYLYSGDIIPLNHTCISVRN